MNLLGRELKPLLNILNLCLNALRSKLLVIQKLYRYTVFLNKESLDFTKPTIEIMNQGKALYDLRRRKTSKV